MQLKNLIPVLALGAGVSAQSLQEVLSSQNASLSELTTLLGANPAIVSALGNATNITILAPSNDALTTFLASTSGQAAAADAGAVANLLLYHVLNGTYASTAFTNSSQFLRTSLSNTTYANVTGGQVVEARLNGTNATLISGLLQESVVTTADLNFTGGVLHIIDRVLTIPQTPSSTAGALNLTSLVGALTNASLAATVDSLTDVTIFAPSNAAFQAIGSALPNLTTAQLAGILTYHVINGTVGYSSGLTNTTLPTVNGGSVTITVVNGSVFVNSAKVIVPDVLVANGVVHVIDGVLNPNNTSAAPPSSGATTTTPAFSGASSATDVPFTSGVTAQTTVTSTPTRAPTSSSSSAGAAQAVKTGAVGMGALFGGALMMNF